MGTSVVNEGEVFLNEKKYKLLPQGNQPGRVRMELLSQFPPKQIIGDATYDNEQYISKWIRTDLRDGLGQEEFDAAHPNRTLWHTCNVDHAGHSTLPAMKYAGTLPTPPTISNGDMEAWDTSSNLTTWAETTGAADAVRQITGANAYAGSFAVELSGTPGGAASISQPFTSASDISGRPFSITFYAHYVSGAGASGVAVLADNVSQTTLALTGSSYTQHKITRIMDISATGMNVKFTATPGAGAAAAVFVDSLVGANMGSTMGPACEFNGDLYFAWGNTLIKLDKSTGSTFSTEGVFANTITDLVASISGPTLYVFLGDNDTYWYRDISGTWATPTAGISQSGNAQYGLDWNGKLWKISTTGTIANCAAANQANPSWTNNGNLNLGTNYVKDLIVDRDATGTEIIYASTRKGLYAHDTTNSLFEKTICEVPDVSSNGNACAGWQGFIWYSAGMRVLKYRAGDTAILEEAGLDKRDGLPAWLGNYTINKFIPGQFCMYVCLSGSYGSLMKINLDGSWHVVAASNANAVNSGILSSVYANRLWFDQGGALSFMTEQSSNMRPGKISGYAYDLGTIYNGQLYDSWFTAGAPGDSKLALSLDFYCRDLGISDTVTPYYQIDHVTGGDVAVTGAGWTALSSITANGLTSRPLGTSGVGVPFKAFRYGYQLSRASTPSPDVQSVTLRYLKQQSMKWGWGMTLDCRDTYAGQTPLQQEANLKTAAEAQTLIAFAFRDANRDADTPHYVKIVPPFRARMEAGQPIAGVYEVNVMEP